MASDANPSQLSAAASIMAERTLMMRAVYGGTQTMRSAGDLYLPQYDKESDKRYEVRLEGAVAVNKLREAVEAASAKPFKSLVRLTNNTDQELDAWIKDIDLQGNHLHIFAHQHFNDSLLVGQGHILVDHPTTSNLPSLGAQKASGVRPYFKHIKDDDLVAAYSEYVGGDVQVVHARIKSARIERDKATFKETLWNQIYVIEKEVGATTGIVQLWEQPATAGGTEWTLVGESPLTLPEVPLVTLYAGEKESDFVTRPTFLDLAYKQIEHFRSSSDQRMILSVSRFPMLAVSGIELDPEDEKNFGIGPFKLLHSPDPNGRWYYVEPAGRAIKSGAEDLAMLEMQMDMMALNPVVATHRQYIPQNERDIAETRVHSVIHDIALQERITLEKAIRFMGMWVNRDYSAVGVSLDSDFTNTSDKMKQVALLLNAYEKKGISRETFLEQARQLDFVDDDFDVAAELARLAAVDAAELAQTTGAVAGAKDDPVAESTTAPVDFPKGQNRPTRQI